MSEVSVRAVRRLPEGATKRSEVDAMFDRLAPRYERMNRVISLGLDGRWRRRAVAALDLSLGSRVLDVGCGTGDLCRELARAGHRAIGLDRSAGMLREARTIRPLVRGDAERPPFPDASLDGVISGFALRNVVSLDALFDACARVLRRGGRFVALETSVPDRAVLRLGHAAWTRAAVPLLGRLLAHDPDAYSYLPRSSAYLPDGDALAARLRRAGFDAVQRVTMTGGAVQLLTGTRV
jgi:demethylmenaquinone methyltransferase / 2-methoxy-6-polyprenyl-1,4-benzoquinol methylase